MLLPSNAVRTATSRSGAALMMSLLVLMVLVLVVWQIGISTSTQYQVARNDVGLTQIDLAIESALLETFEQLLADAEASGAGGEGAPSTAGGLGGLAGAAGGGEEDGAGAQEAASDSRMDEWARPQRTEINGVSMRILIQDENSKFNVLQLLSEDDDEAEKAYQRLVRILDLFREDTEVDLSSSDADRMADAVRDHLRRRRDSIWPRTEQLTADPEDEETGLPLTVREFVALEGFRPEHFRDFRTEDDEVVHSLASYLTVNSSLQTFAEMMATREEVAGAEGVGGGGGANGRDNIEDQEAGGGGGGQDDPLKGNSDGTTSGGGAGGGNGQVAQTGAAGGADASIAGGANSGYGLPGAINLNTAPPVVLKALMDDRDVDPRFWDAVIEYRNEEVEEESIGFDEDEAPVLDEFGEEVVETKIFESLDQLTEFEEYDNIETGFRAEVVQLIGTTSDVFSIYVTARIESGGGGGFLSAAEQEEREEGGGDLTRTVRCTVWRRQVDEGWEIVPIERWEVLPYRPYEIKDFPGEDR